MLRAVNSAGQLRVFHLRQGTGPVEIEAGQLPESQAEARRQLQSHLDGPISGLSLLRQSLLFAELSMVAYMDHENARKATGSLGFDRVEFYEHDGSQAYLFSNHDDSAIVFRGTEPNDWNDIRADINAVSAVAEAIGRVHRGFKQEVDDLWPQLEVALIETSNTLWFAGHSLGGAMATICAGRCKLSHISATPEALFTYGSPRVGDRRYVNYCKLNHYRWVNNNDIVVRVPPRWMGYRHAGREMYLNSRGKLRRLRGLRRLRDGLRGLLGGLRQSRLDHLSDHSIAEYIQHISRLVDESEAT
jgi:triacylglycerol lipase